MELLTFRTWREIRLTALAHNLRFNTNQDKQTAFVWLVQRLSGDRLLRRRYRELSPEALDILQALRAAGGVMPRYCFEALFGPIRRYRPWLIDAPVHPWKRPVSLAEHLWFLGFIEVQRGRGAMVCLPHAVAELLPPLPVPRPALWAHPAKADKHLRHHLLTDIAILLGGIQRSTIRAQWNRWLPPHALRPIAAAFAIPEDCSALRSELQTDRFRFLHYLAAEAHLITRSHGHFALTPLAWDWLRWDARDQWRFMLGCADPGSRLWQQFRLPETDRELWRHLLRELDQLTPDRAYRTADLVAALRPYLPGHQQLAQQVSALLLTVFTWCGMVITRPGRFYLMPQVHTDHTGAHLALSADHSSIAITLTVQPPLRALVDTFMFAHQDGASFYIDAASVQRALAKGISAAECVRILAALQCAPLDPALAKMVFAWADQATSAISLQPAVLLTAPDTAELDALSRDWRLKHRIGSRISPHHALIAVDDAPELIRRLRRRGISVTTDLEPQRKGRVTDELNPSMLDFLWLASRTYQRLGTVMDLPLRLPGALMDWLEDQMPEDSLNNLRRRAAAIQESLQIGYRAPGGSAAMVAQAEPESIAAAVQQAYQSRGSLTIDYYSPYRGEHTTRTIEPISCYTQSGSAYVEAWCQLENDTRTFRLDRILRVHAVYPGTSTQASAGD